LANLNPAHPRHHHIEENDIRHFPCHLIEALLATFGGPHIHILLLQYLLEEVDVNRLVIDHQDFRL
jgi:hypothetical protein